MNHMAVLCDVNVPLALLNANHDFHQPALEWVSHVQSGEAGICRLTQISLLRLLNNPSVMREDVMDTEASWQAWRMLIADQRFIYLATEPMGLEKPFQVFTSGRNFSPNLWTDAYLAAFAQASNRTLVTFDKGFGNFPDLDVLVLN
jgi:uncharacterized protein